MRLSIVLVLLGLATAAWAQTSRQPKVAPGPQEPDWEVILREKYGIAMFDDLANPVRTTPDATPGLFKKAGPGPVTFTPVIALGLETVTRGGWYLAGPADARPRPSPLWSYRYKNTAQDVATGANLPPPLLPNSTTSFDPDGQVFGLWVANDNFQDGGVFSEPRLVAAHNRRLAKQPYKAMIYPNREKATGKVIPHSYLIGWEYSTNDDFQDVVCRVDNVELLKQ